MTKLFYSIIMRTCGRPLMLRRALESVSNQTFRDYELILVHDGENPEVSNNILEEFIFKLPNFTFITTNSSKHMEKVTNEGLKIANGNYICIHDDDDSWQPSFLQEVCNEIRISDNPYPAIMTQFNKIYELVDLENNKIREVCRHNDVNWLNSLQLGFVLAGNIFPPISLVYSKEILEHIGMYDESLKVLGDWDFLLRLQYFTQIKVIKEPLANYHIRLNPEGVYGNSINTEGFNNLHIEYEAYVRHKYQYTKVLLPNFEKKDISSDIVNAKASKTYWHWDYVQEIKKILKIRPDFMKNMEAIVKKIKEKYINKKPKVYLYGAGKIFEELIEKPDFIEYLNDLHAIGVIDKNFKDNSHQNAYTIDILNERLDIDLLIVTLEHPPDAIDAIKNKLKKEVDVFYLASEY